MDYKNVEDMQDTELLREFVENQRRERRYLLTAAGCLAVLTVIIAISALVLIPKSLRTLNNINQLVADTNVMISQADESLDNIDVMVGNVNELVETNQQKINDTIGHLSEIDIDQLNKSIENLNKAVTPLARLFGGRE